MSQLGTRSGLLVNLFACFAAGCTLLDPPGPPRPMEVSWFKAPARVRVATAFTITIEIRGKLCDETIEAAAVVDEASRRITFKGMVRGRSGGGMSCGSSWDARPYYLDATVSTPGSYVVVGTVRPIMDLVRYEHLVPRIEKLSPDLPVELSQTIVAE